MKMEQAVGHLIHSCHGKRLWARAHLHYVVDELAGPAHGGGDQAAALCSLRLAVGLHRAPEPAQLLLH